jgi:hypothetical protein
MKARQLTRNRRNKGCGIRLDAKIDVWTDRIEGSAVYVYGPDVTVFGVGTRDEFTYELDLDGITLWSTTVNMVRSSRQDLDRIINSIEQKKAA